MVSNITHPMFIRTVLTEEETAAFVVEEVIDLQEPEPIEIQVHFPEVAE